MFGFLKKKTVENNNEKILSPILGKAIESSEIPDPTFGEEMLGKGCAIVPSEGKVYSPVDGEVSMIFDTKHAITLTSDMGTEILIHVGLDTVTLKGEPFTILVEPDAKVKAGDPLMEFDAEVIKAAGLSVVSPVVICNTDDFKDVVRFTGKEVKPGDVIMEIVR